MEIPTTKTTFRQLSIPLKIAVILAYTAGLFLIIWILIYIYLMTYWM